MGRTSLGYESAKDLTKLQKLWSSARSDMLMSAYLRLQIRGTQILKEEPSGNMLRNDDSEFREDSKEFCGTSRLCKHLNSIAISIDRAKRLSNASRYQ